MAALVGFTEAKVTMEADMGLAFIPSLIYMMQEHMQAKNGHEENPSRR